MMNYEDYISVAERIFPGASMGSAAIQHAGAKDDTRFVIARGAGGRVEDLQGNWYIDHICGGGGMILGHAHPAVVAAMQDQAMRGVNYFGTLNEPCIRLAEELVEAIPCAEKIAFACTGSEATFFSLRLARAHTGRNKILKFEGGFHGNHDYAHYSISPPSIGNYPVGRPEIAGIPEPLHETVLVAPFNDLEATRAVVEQDADDIAAIILEPVQRIIAPVDGFLEGLRRLCDEHGIVLIFDEAVTGFRLAYGGAQEYFGVLPDLACYAKIIGGGGPISCVAGRAEIIDLCSPANRQAVNRTSVSGSMRGNAMGAAAGLATLKELKRPGFYAAFHSRCEAFRREAQLVLDRHGLPAIVIGEASMWQIYFHDRPPQSYADMLGSDQGRMRALDRELMCHGQYLQPGSRRYISAAHTNDDFANTLRGLDDACRQIS